MDLREQLSGLTGQARAGVEAQVCGQGCRGAPPGGGVRGPPLTGTVDHHAPPCPFCMPCPQAAGCQSKQISSTSKQALAC